MVARKRLKSKRNTPKEEAKAKGKPISPEEFRTILSGPAIASNKMYVTISAAGVRLTFCEQQGEVVPPTFRTAVILSFPDAFALRDLLIRQLAKIDFSQKLLKDDGQEVG